ncbi:MAG: shikimate dehydrogenase [Lentisphaerae bacterium]|nr:shikimate dehydrogenase [Lentisphaerota bacterium]
MKPGGHTLPFAVLGHPIGHTLSPVMHNAAFAALGMDAVYLAFDVHPDRLMGVLPAMRDLGFAGVNLTVPLKEVAFRGLTDLEPAARRLGAVNTVEFRDAGPRGHNTDGYGFLRAMDEAFGAGVRGLDVFVLGCGGAGRAVALTCAAEGARRLVLADLLPGRAAGVAAEIAAASPGVAVETAASEAGARVRAARRADLVVQATPAGMRTEDPAPLPGDAFRPGQMAFDLVYMYPDTAFTKAARAAGARARNGLGMLLHQGARALEIWTGRQPPLDAMRAALEKTVYGEAA